MPVWRVSHSIQMTFKTSQYGDTSSNFRISEVINGKSNVLAIYLTMVSKNYSNSSTSLNRLVAVSPYLGIGELLREESPIYWPPTPFGSRCTPIERCRRG